MNILIIGRQWMKSNLLRWVKGRQNGTEYYKFTLWYFKIGKIGTDAYILKYIGPTQLQPHKDPVPNGDHYRLNIKLKGDSTFYCDGRKPSNKIIEFFRPDLLTHSLDVYSDTIKFSIGIVKFK